MPKDGATERKGSHRAREALESVWRAVRSAPRSLLYPVLGALLYLTTTSALLSAVGLPDTVEGKTVFLVMAYSGVALFALVGYVLGGSFDEARRLSTTDPLTGVYNRRHFGQRLSDEARRARRFGHTSSVLCVDVDHLKAINDGFGHRAGDRAIVAVCRALVDNVRTIDVVARLGGDEFAVLLPETSAAQASALSQRVLAEVAWQGDVLGNGLAISIGIADLNTAADRESGDLLEAADEALYRAKAVGGGGRCVAGSSQEGGPPWAWRVLDRATRASAP